MSVIGFRVQTLNHGPMLVPTSAEHESELAGRGVDVVPYAAVEALAMVANVFPAAKVESLRFGAKLKGRKR